uniref:Leucine-rich repeat-containing N-terminal plant-type domain-containing protein n=1 Tax=Rhizophora mucronata TaxID=61149 RepID=A0A2P2MXB9_RHIMU
MENSTILWMVLPLVIWLITGAMLCDVSARVTNCQESEKQALLDLKMGIEDAENRLSPWQGNNCCQWWGIACDNSTRAVLVVDFHNPYPSNFDSSGRHGFWNLKGEIRPSLTQLKSLRYLDLSFNTFNGKFPIFLPLCRIYSI